MERKKNKVFCLVGDAELSRGEVWEAAMVAGHMKLDNLILIVDKNGIKIDEVVKNNVFMEPINEKFDSFGWKSINVYNGHDFDEILGAYLKALTLTRFPVVIVAKTVKAKGVGFAEGKQVYQNKPLGDEELEEAIKVLEKQLSLIS